MEDPSEKAEQPDCLFKAYDKNFARKAEPFVRYSSASLIVLVLIMWLCSLKWRKFSNSFLYLELLYQIDISFVPSNLYERYSPFNIYLFIFFYFVGYYTDQGLQIICIFVSMILLVFIPGLTLYWESVPLTLN